jgi:formate-dependent nitrite reductase membrane component NrfD
MLSMVWHYWLGIALAVGGVASVVAMVAGYLKKVESTRYPRAR